jgi:hypothetical protein
MLQVGATGKNPTTQSLYAKRKTKLEIQSASDRHGVKI